MIMASRDKPFVFRGKGLKQAIDKWDSRMSEKLEGIGIKKPQKTQTRHLLAQFIGSVADNSELVRNFPIRARAKFSQLPILIRNKKGDIINILPAVLILFVVMVMFLIGGLVWNEISADPQLQGAANTTQAKVMANNNDFWIFALDNMFVFLYGGLCLVLLISAALVRTQPMFFVPLLIVFVFLTGIMFFIQNITDDIVADNSWNAIRLNFSKTFFIMDNIIGFAAGMGLLVLIVFFASARYMGGGS